MLVVLTSLTVHHDEGVIASQWRKDFSGKTTTVLQLQRSQNSKISPKKGTSSLYLSQPIYCQFNLNLLHACSYDITHGTP
ncbi:hypothetical protein CEXT_489771 [Caerostris extrusa]|uniref:Uncharacterized protein n=1 Tax=Caerostris extrusa TaxID=172846 RepID=A0AAV4PJJ9_CAEEX|nr:hypothetical protein CEXT_489771 [Caerostris extrusa]